MFYCDPSFPGQKGVCENNHEFIKRVSPKGVDIGSYSEDKNGLMINNTISYSMPKLGGKSSYEMFLFYYGRDILNLFDVRLVRTNDIVLKPELLK